MPQGAEILCVHAQFNLACIYAKVEPDNPNEVRTISAYITGQVIGLNSKYIGTVLLNEGSFVLHVFEEIW